MHYSQDYSEAERRGVVVHDIVPRIHDIFNNEMLRSFLSKFRYPMFIAFFILLIPQIRPSLLLPGFLMSLFGELIQIWSLASLEKNRKLAVKGPYMLTRNPMYIGRFFLILGGIILIGNIWVILGFIIIYYFYAVNRVKREERRLRLLFGEQYEDYCRKLNRFMPSLKLSNRRTLWSFKWGLLLQNNGHKNLMAVLSGYLVLYLYTFIV
jgi:protein-S-isoprenylcysteine O-methyltransferase Ste14